MAHKLLLQIDFLKFKIESVLFQRNYHCETEGTTDQLELIQRVVLHLVYIFCAWLDSVAFIETLYLSDPEKKNALS